MIIIVVAMYCEAKPIIEHFGLKKLLPAHRLDVYASNGVSMIISGIGMIKSAVAATYMLTGKNPSDISGIINLGICGSVSTEVGIGTPVLFNKIVNTETNRAFYPDMIAVDGFTEGALHSFSSPVTRECIIPSGTEYADMEAAGFIEASSAFLPLHKVYCLKVVSDYLESKCPDTDKVNRLIYDNICSFERLISMVHKLNKSGGDILTGPDYDLMNSIADKLMLSVTMRYQLRDLARLYAIRTGNRPGLILASFSEMQMKSKKEGKLTFEEIKKLMAGE